MTNFELATRVPFIIRAPWIPNAPRRSAALVELVDLAPTMAALAGIGLPAGEVFDGVSLVPLLDGSAQTVKPAVSCKRMQTRVYLRLNLYVCENVYITQRPTNRLSYLWQF